MTILRSSPTAPPPPNSMIGGTTSLTIPITCGCLWLTRQRLTQEGCSSSFSLRERPLASTKGVFQHAGNRCLNGPLFRLLCFSTCTTHSTCLLCFATLALLSSHCSARFAKFAMPSSLPFIHQLAYSVQSLPLGTVEIYVHVVNAIFGSDLDCCQHQKHAQSIMRPPNDKKSAEMRLRGTRRKTSLME